MIDCISSDTDEDKSHKIKVKGSPVMLQYHIRISS